MRLAQPPVAVVIVDQDAGGGDSATDDATTTTVFSLNSGPHNDVLTYLLAWTQFFWGLLPKATAESDDLQTQYRIARLLATSIAVNPYKVGDNDDDDDGIDDDFDGKPSANPLQIPTPPLVRWSTEHWDALLKEVHDLQMTISTRHANQNNNNNNDHQESEAKIEKVVRSILTQKALAPFRWNLENQVKGVDDNNPDSPKLPVSHATELL